MDVNYLCGVLISDPDKIFTVLEALGYTPHDKGKYIHCKNLDGDNESAIVIYKEKLKYINYTRDKKGNIVTLIMNTKDCSFPEALRWLAKTLGIKADKPRVKVHYPFGGFYRKLQPEDSERVTFTKYSDDDLPPADSLSYRFFKDGITYDVQWKWGIRYDHNNDSIWIPIKNTNGKLVGAKARNNNDDDFSRRWYMPLAYPKSGVLYGFFENYKNIIEKGIVIVVESEKGVLQLCSMGIHIGVALGGHDISQIQARYLKALQCKIILVLDEDISEEENEKQAAKLDGCKVFYLKDREHKYLTFGGKESPTDKGKKVLKQMLKECLVRFEP